MNDAQIIRSNRISLLIMVFLAEVQRTNDCTLDYPSPSASYLQSEFNYAGLSVEAQGEIPSECQT